VNKLNILFTIPLNTCLHDTLTVFVQFCEKFRQVDTKTILITLIQPKMTYCLSTFRLHVGTRSQSWWRLPTWSRNVE